MIVVYKMIKNTIFNHPVENYQFRPTQIGAVTTMISNIMFVILFELLKRQIKKQKDEKKSSLSLSSFTISLNDL